jgi:hypothetical protein
VASTIRTADEYHVNVKMQAGPFTIDQDNDSVLNPKQARP